MRLRAMKFSLNKIILFSTFLILNLTAFEPPKGYMKVEEWLKVEIPRFKASGATFNDLKDDIMEMVVGNDPAKVYNIITIEGQWSDRPITCDFTNLTIEQIISNLCRVTGANYRVERNAVIIGGSDLKDLDKPENKLRRIQRQIADLKKEETRLKRLIKPEVKAVKGQVERKLDLIIPKLRFEDRDIEFAIDFFTRKVRSMDPEGESLSFVTNLKFDEDKPLFINITADNLPVEDALRYSCEMLGYDFQISNGAVVIYDPKDEMESKVYELPNSNFHDERGLVDYLKKIGVSFVNGSQYKLIRGTNKFLLKTDNKSHKFLDEVLKELR